MRTYTKPAVLGVCLGLLIGLVAAPASAAPGTFVDITTAEIPGACPADPNDLGTVDVMDITFTSDGPLFVIGNAFGPVYMETLIETTPGVFQATIQSTGWEVDAISALIQVTAFESETAYLDDSSSYLFRDSPGTLVWNPCTFETAVAGLSIFERGTGTNDLGEDLALIQVKLEGLSGVSPETFTVTGPVTVQTGTIDPIQGNPTHTANFTFADGPGTYTVEAPAIGGGTLSASIQVTGVTSVNACVSRNGSITLSETCGRNETVVVLLTG